MATCIRPGLWLGDYKDAALNGKYDIILDVRGWFVQDKIEAKVLDIIADVIDGHLCKNKIVLVHSEHGFKRAPLVVAWYLVKYHHSSDMQAAYEIIGLDRPLVQDCSKWIG